jgi:iron complex outermembrane recepter protein
VHRPWWNQVIFCAGLCSFASHAIASDDANRLEQVIVSAERQPADAQQLPMAITALSGVQIDAASVQSTADLQDRVPDFLFKTNSAFGQPYIRGVGSDVISSGGDSSVAVFVDDVYQARALASYQDFFDVDRVEIVKGPESTLYGRNATGGALRIYTNRPATGFSVSGDALYGNFNDLRLRGAMNLPVRDDTLTLRIAGLRTTRDGYIQNIVNGSRLDGEDLWSARAELLWRPNDTMQLLLINGYAREDSTRNVGPHPNATCCTSLGLLLGGIDPPDPREVTNDTTSYIHSTQRTTSARLDWDVGGARFTSISARNQSSLQELLDADSTNIAAVTDQPSENSDMYSEDLQLSSRDTERFHWVTGLYYLHERAFERAALSLPVFGASSVPQGTVLTDAYSAFGEVRTDLTRRWRLSAGLRYSRERRTEDFVQQMIDPTGALGGPPGTLEFAAKDSHAWSSWTPRLTLEHFCCSGLSLYGTVAEGFKAGGYNLTAQQAAFAPETLWAYELGLKMTGADQRLRMNAAAFWYDYRNIQVLSLPPGSVADAVPTVFNAAAATIAGLEMDLAVQLNGLRVDVAPVYLDARFTRFESVDPNNPQSNPDRSGQRMPEAPKYSVATDVQYGIGLARLGTLTLRSDWHYRSLTYFNSFADRHASQSGYGIADARATLDLAAHWFVALYGKNLANKLYAQAVIRQDPLLGELLFWGPPRTYGIEVGLRH